MAETFAYQQDPETTSLDNLSEEEKSSLEVGQELRTEQENLLAGKYKDAQELENAYLELQKKLGTDKAEPSEDSQEPPETEAKDEPEKQPEIDTSFLDTVWEEYKADDFTDSTIDKLKEMSAAEFADMHVKYRESVEAKNAVEDLSEDDVQRLKAVAGEEGEYEKMLTWAQKNLGKNEIDMFDAVIDRGDRLASFFAVRSLAYRYQDAMGVQPDLITGTAPKASVDQFRSQQEVVAAMSDPRYDRDPAYRAEIADKLKRSEIHF